jgi:hypothetical protein
MKKIKSILIIAAVLGAAQVFAQSSMEESVNGFGNSFENAPAAREISSGPQRSNPGNLPGPVGEGVAVLTLLGAAYAGFKAKRNRKR